MSDDTNTPAPTEATTTEPAAAPQIDYDQLAAAIVRAQAQQPKPAAPAPKPAPPAMRPAVSPGSNATEQLAQLLLTRELRAMQEQQRADDAARAATAASTATSSLNATVAAIMADESIPEGERTNRAAAAARKALSSMKVVPDSRYATPQHLAFGPLNSRAVPRK